MDKNKYKTAHSNFRTDVGFHDIRAFLLFVIFLFLNSLKIDFIEQKIIQSMAYSVLSCISKKFILYFLFNAIIFLTLASLKNRFFLLLFYILQATYLFAHFSYFLYFNRPFHSQQFILLFSEGLSLIKHCAIPKNIKYLIIFLDLPVFILIDYLKLNRAIKAYNKTFNLLKIALLIAIISLFSFRWSKISNDIKNRDNGETDIIVKYGVFTNDFLDLLLHRHEELLIRELNYGETLSFQGKTRDGFKNIICIQVESLDPDIINLKYKNQYVTPFLHQLSAQCIYYPYMYHYPGAGGSSDNEFTVINGSISLRNYPIFKLRDYDYPNSLAKQLSKANFTLLAFHNNIGSFFNRDTAYIKMGFQEFYDPNKMQLQEKGWGTPDIDMLNYVESKLKIQDTPFLYYIITMSSHEPFNFVRNYYNNGFYNDINDILVKNYFNSMSYVDSVLEEFILFVKNNMKDVYVFIYGDHPAWILEDVLFKNRYSDCVPLFIITPDGKRYVENNKFVSQLDLAPTILYASGIDFEIRAKGVNLLNFPIIEESIAYESGEICSRKDLFNQAKEKSNSQRYTILKKDKLPELVAHAGGAAGDFLGTNSLEAIDASYKKGFKYIELDFEWTSDKHLVMIHDWTSRVTELFNVGPKVYSLSEFKKFKMAGNLKQMTLDNLINWLKKHPDVFIITDIKRDNVDALRYISRQYSHIQNQIIPQIYSFAEYDATRNLGFSKIILTLYIKNYPDDDLLEFLRDNSVLAVTMPVYRAMTNLPLKLKSMGIFIYAHTVNEAEEMVRLKANGVDGFYTDLLKP